MSIQNSGCLSRAYNASFHSLGETARSLAKSGLSAARYLQVPLTVAFIAGYSIQIAYKGCKKIQESSRVWDRATGLGMIGLGAVGVTAAAALAFQNLGSSSNSNDENGICKELFMKFDLCCPNRTGTEIYTKIPTDESIRLWGLNTSNQSTISCYPNGSSVIESNLI